MKSGPCNRRFLSQGSWGFVPALASLALLLPQAGDAESLHPWLDRRAVVVIGAVAFNVDATIASWTESARQVSRPSTRCAALGVLPFRASTVLPGSPGAHSS